MSPEPSGSGVPHITPISIPGADTPTPGGHRPHHQLSHSAGQQSSWPEPQYSASSSYFPPFSSRPSHSARQTSPVRTFGGRAGSRGPMRSTSLSGPSQRREKMNRSASVATSASYNSRNADEPDIVSEEVEDDEDENVDEVGEMGNGVAEEENLEGDDELADQLDTRTEDDPVTLRERQSLMNVEHPFGLPIWKPALYKKSRTVTRAAETAIHNIPTPERHITPGNIFWAVFFGWWIAAVCFVVAGVLLLVPFGGRRYAWLVGGLGWYIFWPFGKYVEGNLEEDAEMEREWSRARDEEIAAERAAERRAERGRRPSGSESGGTIKGIDFTSPPPRVDESEEETDDSTERPPPDTPPELSSSASNPFASPSQSPTSRRPPSSSWVSPSSERSPLLQSPALELPDGHASRTVSDSSTATPRPPKTKPREYGTIPTRAPPVIYPPVAETRDMLGRLVYWILFPTLIAPLLLWACAICFGLALPIPMAKLNWALLKFLFTRPLSIRFCSAPAIIVPSPPHAPANQPATIKPTRLRAGQLAPSGGPRSTVLLCTYRAAGLQYYKYTIGGVNILFVNLLPFIGFVIFDAFVLLPLSDRQPSPFLSVIASRALIFCLSLLSVIPLSYFIGMAVASISAQSSIGMGAVINATFGSIIEIILYSIALSQGKGLLVEGSIVGSLLAGVLLMPGVSMCSGALKRKEQKFNAKSAGVTSTMLIMAIIGTLTPTMFYQTYGNFELTCEGCPAELPGTQGQPWQCKKCYYEHPNPTTDPFYQDTVKNLMYFCAAILLLSYLIGLWFSLRTHASQIWQNPQQLMQPLEVHQGHPGTGRMYSMYHKLVNQQLSKSPLPTHIRTGNLSRKPSIATTIGSLFGNQPIQQSQHPQAGSHTPRGPSTSPTMRRSQTAIYPSSMGNGNPGPGYGPLIETVNQAVKSSANANFQPMPLPPNLTTDDFTRAVAVATVSALRHQQAQSPARPRTSMGHHEQESGGHEGPSWSRTVSAAVLLACTALYAIIAEILVNVVDVVLDGSGIDEKFLGLTLFALVPNTTEFMNAMSFAINGNIALSMEIGSAYALQVCLLQIPAMVAFSAWSDPRRFGDMADTFTLIFPRWDVIAIILSIFLLTYVYIEARSNYHRGSTLILSYTVLLLGFYYAPSRPAHSPPREQFPMLLASGLTAFSAGASPSWAQYAKTLFYSIWTR